MERLTFRDSEGNVYLALESEERYTPIELIDLLLNHLAAYEDTGLEPEDIKTVCDADVAETAKKLRQMIERGEMDLFEELLRAEKNGQLIKLPCKVGDKVYIIVSQYDGKKFVGEIVEPATVDSITFGDAGIPILTCCTKEDGWYAAEPGEYYLTREAAEQALKEQTK